MIEAIIAWSVRRRWLVVTAASLLALAGFWGAMQTPLDAIPDLSETQLIVFTDWPGHAPQEVEDQVTYPLSLHLRGIDGIRTLRGSSDFNYSMIHIIFEDGLDISTARRSVTESLANLQAGLPAEASVRLAPDAPATGQIFWYTLEGEGFDLGELRTIQDWHVRHQLAAVEGVAEVASVGGFPQEFRVAIDPLRLSAHGLSVADVSREISRAASPAGGQVLHSPTSEYLVRASGIGIGEKGEEFQSARAIRDLENLVIVSSAGQRLRLDEIARVTLAPGPRRGVLEKDGNEVVGGVVMMRYGENPLALTRRLNEKIADLQASLPTGIRIVPGYDRTPLITSAVGTVGYALLEAIAVATICVLLVLMHIRTSLVIALALPLAVLASFLVMWLLRILGIASIETNIMSLAGLTISIGVLVDSSIVIAENVMHRLHGEFGDEPIRGNVAHLVIPACQQVGRPIFFSVLIMLLSFLPVFALGGLEGKMFRPLAFTKSFALGAAVLLAITLVPALCSFFVRGRLRGERESWLVRTLMDVYLPLLRYLLDRPAAIVWIAAVTLLLGVAPLGVRWQGYPVLLLAILGGAVLAAMWLGRTRTSRLALGGSLILIALTSDRLIQPLPSEFLSPLDEGIVMDMPITVPRASVSQAADDLKARDMLLCRFPEIEMVMGKAGRADTPTDPAPVDMIETMVSFRPEEFWPKRKLTQGDAEIYTRRVYSELLRQKLGSLPRGTDEATFLKESVSATLPRFDLLLREVAYQRNAELLRELEREMLTAASRETLRQLAGRGQLTAPFTDGDVAWLASRLPASLGKQLAQGPSQANTRQAADQILVLLAERKLLVRDQSAAPNPLSGVRRMHRLFWQQHLSELDQELAARGSGTFIRLALEDLTTRLTVQSPELQQEVEQLRTFRATPAKPARGSSHHGPAQYKPPQIDPLPILDGIQQKIAGEIATAFLLWRKDRSDLVGFGGELDQALQMPGWTNVWTMPIQNRVDMLATGVNTTIGIRVLGRRLEDVISASENVAEIVRQIPGATSVAADPVRGKGYLDITIHRDAAARLGVSAGDLNDVISSALGGKQAASLTARRERYPVRITFPPALRDDVEAIRRLPVPAGQTPVVLGQVADVKITQGPASIKSENGLLRNYVRLNVKDRSAMTFVNEAKQVLAQKATLPPGVYLEWTGQFEHQARAARRLWIVGPLVLVLIVIILYYTYRDLADALLILPAVAGALAGGLFLQWLLGYKTSVTVAIGYIACIGMAASTGIIMLVYLRDAVERAGGLARITLPQLKEAVLRGAVHRLRPKLLTEATTILGLAPMLFATGVGSEVIRPMAAPVLGGILIADEVIDLLLPVMFYYVRRWRWQKIHATHTTQARETSAPAELLRNS